MSFECSWRRLAGLGVALTILGCGGGQAGLHSSASYPLSVVLKDSSPGQLAAYVNVSLGGYDASTRDRILITVNFQHDGRPVKFVAGEHVSCGEVALKPFIGGFEADASTASIAGRAMTCKYVSGEHSATFAFRVPMPLAILSPREREHVAHGPGTTVSYSGALDTTLWVVALGANAKAFAQPAAVTPTRATLDTSALHAGDGSVSVTEPNPIPLLELQGAQFHSISGWSRATTMVAVVWI